MSTQTEAELAGVLAQLRRSHDILPFLATLLSSGEATFHLLPAEMLEQLQSSPDFGSLRTGEPVWMTIAAPPDSLAEIVLYRARGDGRYYIVTPHGQT